MTRQAVPLMSVDAVDEPTKVAPAPSLKRQVVRGTGWTVLAYGLSQVLRLASNLVLTRLLLPEAFGVMGIVQIVLQGLQMFCDLGVSTAAVRHPKGDDERFLNTVWTISLTRSIGLFGLVVLLSWPAAWFYGIPQLKWLLPATGVTVLLGGMASTSLITVQRRMDLGRLTAFELTTQVIGLAATVALAWAWPSVWALVIGGLVAAAVRTAGSFVALPGIRHRFAVDKAYAAEVVRFGRWILVGSALTFIVAQGDRAVLGKVLEPARFGIYGLAFFLSQAVVEVVRTVGGRVLFPAYAKLNEQGAETLGRQVYRSRAVLMGVFLPAVWALAIFGNEIIRVLYPRAYWDAGWMLKLLSVGSIGAIVSLTSSSVLLSVGDSFRYSVVLAVRSALLVGLMILGGWWGGWHWGGDPDGQLRGLIIGFVASSYLNYPVLAWAVRKYRVWFPGLDLAAIGASAAAIGLGWWLW